MDYAVTAKYIAQSATRALGLLISKFKVGEMPYEVFTSLYHTMVWSAISYGAGIWGTKEFSSVNAVQNTECSRKWQNGMGTAVCETVESVLGQWFRLNSMDNCRINKKASNWSYSVKDGCKKWCFQVEKYFKNANIETLIPRKDNFYSQQSRKYVIEQLQNKLFDDFKAGWSRKLLSDNSIGNNNGGNKLRTYRLFKHDYQVEFYVKANFIPRWNRSVLAKFRTRGSPFKGRGGTVGIFTSRTKSVF